MSNFFKNYFSVKG